MKIQNLLGWLLKGIAVLAALGILLLSTGVFLYSFFEIYKVLKIIFFESSYEGEVILKALKAIDLVLLGVTFFIISTGLYELFVGDIENLPEWLVIKNIDQLKGMLIKVIIVVMGVSFTGRIVTWDGKSDLMGYGLGLAAVILALSYFLRVKTVTKKGDTV